MPHDTTSTKVCSKCSAVKPLAEFSRRSARPDGRQNYCKACQVETNRAYYEANRERREANRESRAEYYRAWCEANKEHKSEYDRAYRAANRERRLETNRAWRIANPEKVEQYYARYYSRHPDRHKARLAVGKAILRGKIPPARNLPCASCGEPAQEYHHYLGYAREHWLDVQALCITCHNAQHPGNIGDEGWP